MNYEDPDRMADIDLSPEKITKLLVTIRRNQAESSYVDGKETLELSTDGDKAFFIRHVAALANTGRDAYLLIGVENKTWASKGIQQGSPLLDVDKTQQTMNQTLANRLDPPFTVVYRTCFLESVTMGVVGVEGKSPPYVVSIEDRRFGGPKSKGSDSYIYRGDIYVRRVTDSVVANRQREILELLPVKRNIFDLIGSILLIGITIGAGVGIVASLVRFTRPSDASIIGFIWGLFIGGLFNKRLGEAFGRFRSGRFEPLIKSAVGPFGGGSFGALLAYTLIENILSGKAKLSDPVSMGMIMGPFLAVLSIVIIVVPLVALYWLLHWLEKVIEGRGQKT